MFVGSKMSCLYLSQPHQHIDYTCAGFHLILVNLINSSCHHKSLLVQCCSQRERLHLISRDKSVTDTPATGRKKSNNNILKNPRLSEASSELFFFSSVAQSKFMPKFECVQNTTMTPGPLIIAAGIHYLKACWEKQSAQDALLICRHILLSPSRDVS